MSENLTLSNCDHKISVTKWLRNWKLVANQQSNCIEHALSLYIGGQIDVVIEISRFSLMFSSNMSEVKQPFVFIKHTVGTFVGYIKGYKYKKRQTKRCSFKSKLFVKKRIFCEHTTLFPDILKSRHSSNVKW